jgi:hypothetical protein
MSVESRDDEQKYRSRWRSGNRKKLRAELTSRILGAKPLTDLDPATVDGRLDLRGFSLERTPEPPHVRGARSPASTSATPR